MDRKFGKIQLNYQFCEVGIWFDRNENHERLLVKVSYLLSEIGPGWSPAIINSSLEFEFIGRQHRRLSNHMSFFTGGSAIALGSTAGWIKYTKKSDFFLEKVWSRLILFSYVNTINLIATSNICQHCWHLL